MHPLKLAKTVDNFGSEIRKHLIARRDHSKTICAFISCPYFSLFNCALACYTVNSNYQVEQTSHSAIADTMDAGGQSIAGLRGCINCWQAHRDRKQYCKHYKSRQYLVCSIVGYCLLSVN
jgi:hypothetical protein